MERGMNERKIRIKCTEADKIMGDCNVCSIGTLIILKITVQLQEDQFCPVAFKNLSIRGFHDRLAAMNSVVHYVDHACKAPFLHGRLACLS